MAAAPAAVQERVQVGPATASRSAESTGNAVEQEQPAESSSGRLTELVPVVAAPATVQERVQVGPVSESPSAESIGNMVYAGARGQRGYGQRAGSGRGIPGLRCLPGDGGSARG